MTSKLRAAGATLARLAAALLATLIVASGGVAYAQLNVAFTAFDNDTGGYGLFLAGQLDAEADANVWDANRTVPSLAALGCPGARLDTAPGCLFAFAADADIDLIIEGAVDVSVPPSGILITVVDATEAVAIDQFEVPLVAGIVEAATLRTTLERLVSIVDDRDRVRDAERRRRDGNAGTSSTTNTSNAVRATREPRERDLFDPDQHYVEVEFDTEFVTRDYQRTQGVDSVNFDAPYYAGMQIGVTLYPIAFFAAHTPAAPLALHFETAKHKTNTLSDVEVSDGIWTLDIPTRHDSTFYGASYRWRADDRLVLTPTLGLRVVEFSLGYNPLYGSSFYRGIEVGAAVDYLASSRWIVEGEAAIRPAVSLGSGETEFGTDGSSFGFGIEAGLRYVTDLGVFARAAARYDRYTTSWDPPPGEQETTATDGFQTFVIGIGYAY